MEKRIDINSLEPNAQSIRNQWITLDGKIASRINKQKRSVI